MDDPVAGSLIVTGIGMLLLFLALAILYGLMVLMTWITAIRRPVTDQRQADEQPIQRSGRHREQRRAAAITVALARARQELSSIGTTGREVTVSAWQALHRHRQLTLNIRASKAR